MRPGSRENAAYFPMHKKGAIQMGNGGDNGNGSAGTFYEGVMVSGHPPRPSPTRAFQTTESSRPNGTRTIQVVRSCSCTI